MPQVPIVHLSSGNVNEIAVMSARWSQHAIPSPRWNSSTKGMHLYPKIGNKSRRQAGARCAACTIGGPQLPWPKCRTRSDRQPCSHTISQHWLDHLISFKLWESEKMVIHRLVADVFDALSFFPLAARNVPSSSAHILGVPHCRH